MVHKENVREDLVYFLKYQCMSTLDSTILLGVLFSTWNPKEFLFNAYQSSIGIVVERRVKWWNQ